MRTMLSESLKAYVEVSGTIVFLCNILVVGKGNSAQ